MVTLLSPTCTTGLTMKQSGPSSILALQKEIEGRRRLIVRGGEGWKEPRSDNRCSGYVWNGTSNHTKKCDKQFGYFVRKHNCRQCGDVFCSSCCPKTQEIPVVDAEGTNMKRVCNLCYQKREQQNSKSNQKKDATPSRRNRPHANVTQKKDPTVHPSRRNPPQYKKTGRIVKIGDRLRSHYKVKGGKRSKNHCEATVTKFHADGRVGLQFTDDTFQFVTDDFIVRQLLTKPTQSTVRPSRPPVKPVPAPVGSLNNEPRQKKDWKVGDHVVLNWRGTFVTFPPLEEFQRGERGIITSEKDEDGEYRIKLDKYDADDLYFTEEMFCEPSALPRKGWRMKIKSLRLRAPPHGVSSMNGKIVVLDSCLRELSKEKREEWWTVTFLDKNTINKLKSDGRTGKLCVRLDALEPVDYIDNKLSKTRRRRLLKNRNKSILMDKFELLELCIKHGFNPANKA